MADRVLHDLHVAIFGWTVLALVFLDELLVMAAFGIWGWQHDPRWLLVWAAAARGMLVWYYFASPKAKYGGGLVRPVAKVIVFSPARPSPCGTPATRPGPSMFFVFSVVINALALLPSIRVLVEQE